MWNYPSTILQSVFNCLINYCLRSGTRFLFSIKYSIIFLTWLITNVNFKTDSLSYHFEFFWFIYKRIDKVIKLQLRAASESFFRLICLKKHYLFTQDFWVVPSGHMIYEMVMKSKMDFMSFLSRIIFTNYCVILEL